MVGLTQTFKQKHQGIPNDSSSGVAIGTSTWMLLGGTALFFDTTGALVNIIPIAGVVFEELNDLFADMTFWLWFTLLGTKYSKTTLFGSFALKFIPGINLLPEYTIAMVMLYMQSKSKKVIAKVPGGNLAMKRIDSKNQQARTYQARVNGSTISEKQPSKVVYTHASPASKDQDQKNLPNISTSERQINITRNQSQNKKDPEEMRNDLEKLKRMRGYDSSTGEADWTRDRSVDEAMRIRNKRQEVANRLDMNKEHTVKTILDMEKREHNRKANNAA